MTVAGRLRGPVRGGLVGPLPPGYCYISVTGRARPGPAAVRRRAEGAGHPHGRPRHHGGPRQPQHGDRGRQPGRHAAGGADARHRAAASRWRTTARSWRRWRCRWPGLMTPEPVEAVGPRVEAYNEQAAAHGILRRHALANPLAGRACRWPVIPEVKISDLGLVHVTSQQMRPTVPGRVNRGGVSATRPMRGRRSPTPSPLPLARESGSSRLAALSRASAQRSGAWGRRGVARGAPADARRGGRLPRLLPGAAALARRSGRPGLRPAWAPARGRPRPDDAVHALERAGLPGPARRGPHGRGRRPDLAEHRPLPADAAADGARLPGARPERRGRASAGRAGVHPDGRLRGPARGARVRRLGRAHGWACRRVPAAAGQLQPDRPDRAAARAADPRRAAWPRPPRSLSRGRVG